MAVETTGASAPVLVETTGASAVVAVETTGASAAAAGPGAPATVATGGPTVLAAEMPGAGALVAEATGAVTVETTGAIADVAEDTTEPPLPELPLPELPVPEPPLPEPLPELTGCGDVADVTDAAADVTAERAEPAPEPELVADGGVGAAEAGGAAVELAGAGAGGAGGAGGELAGAMAAELAGAAGGRCRRGGRGDRARASRSSRRPAGSWRQGGGALAAEAAPLTADVAWETACPTADEPVPEPPWDAPDVACVAVEAADPSTDDKPPADDEPPPPELDAADAEPRSGPKTLWPSQWRQRQSLRRTDTAAGHL